MADRMTSGASHGEQGREQRWRTSRLRPSPFRAIGDRESNVAFAIERIVSAGDVTIEVSAEEDEYRLCEALAAPASTHDAGRPND